jgi:hypothetical protein
LVFKTVDEEANRSLCINHCKKVKYEKQDNLYLFVGNLFN